ncbi:hypothetical protein GPECTOR_22g861 [Gonium pectorale]|uniref:Uncharacterized protein n=1 Tax=Gonium pectorale TaxID=33097 RepID=A0A150GHE8_GONPE|nr:hypothetical protein GPECTOR_22g861 [Gonium pectorale]|eukprot:KXZ49268.1 hypothetical protein GPECTOR_22g861 [Gonium pectorale]
MAAQAPAATYQSWTGSVALYLPRPPRIALYPTPPPPAAGAAPPGARNAEAVGSQQQQQQTALQDAHHAGQQVQAATPAAARQQQPLSSVTGKPALRGSWLLSRGAATLTAALSGEGRGMFEVKPPQQPVASRQAPSTDAQVQLGDTVLWSRDLFEGGGSLRLLEPTPQQAPPGRRDASSNATAGVTAVAAAPGSAAAAQERPAQQQLAWLLLLLPAPLSTQQQQQQQGHDVKGGSGDGSRNADGGGGGGQSATGADDAGTGRAAGAPVRQSAAAAGAAGAAAGVRPPPAAICFRFNTEGEGRAFRSLLEAVERAREAVVSCAAVAVKEREVAQERRRQLKLQRREQREAAQTGIGILFSMWVPGSLYWTTVRKLVARVKAVWDEMEEAAERQLAGQTDAVRGPA